MDNQNKANTPSSEQKVWAALSYVWVMSFVVLILKKDSFVHAHAKQGLLIFVGECIIFVPIIWMLIGWLIGLIAFICAFIGFFKAIQGEEWKVPFIGEWWDKTIRV